MTNARPTKKTFDKYFYYHASVQSPETDVEFFRDTYKEVRGTVPQTLREDFCGTHDICCQWVKLNPQFKAIGVDLDPEPIAYGQQHYASKLTAEQKKRLTIQQSNVLGKDLPQADIIVAVNFSYFIFKERATMLSYFKNVRTSLKANGLFMADCFGGNHCMEPNEEETYYEDMNFSYYWDQDSFDPVTNEAMFYIHFKPEGMRKQKQCFTYDWRMWSIPELRDIMHEAGFSKVHTYWEGTTEDGEGDGNFTPVKHGEHCEAWVAYLVGEK